MAALIAFYNGLSTPFVRILQSGPGRALQYFLRFVAEARPVALLVSSFISMMYSLHNSTQDAIQPILLLNYTRGCIESCTCDENVLLDYGSASGSWRGDMNDTYLGLLNQTLGAIGVLALGLTIGVLIPFFTFRPPKELEDGDIIDTALCFHINMFNQKPCVDYSKMVLVAVISVGDLVAIVTAPNAEFMLRVLLFPLLLAYVSILFMYPYAKYNQMEYDDYVAVFKADGHMADVADMKPHHIFLKLIIHNSKLRVLDEVSRQAMADMQAMGIEAKAPPQTIAPPQVIAWAASSPKISPARRSTSAQ